MKSVFGRDEIGGPELSLLSLDDIRGEKKLEVFEKFGLVAETSYLSRVRNVRFLYGNFVIARTNKADQERYCGYITSSIYYGSKNPGAYYVSGSSSVGINDNGDWAKFSYHCTRLKLTKIPNYILDYIDSNKKINDKGVYEVELGEFYLDELDWGTKTKLNEYANKNDKCDEFYFFNADVFPVYKFEGKYYIRYGDIDEEYCWIEKVPVVWLIDEKTNMLVSKKSFFPVRACDIISGSYEKYMEEKMFTEMFDNIFRRIHNKFIIKKFGVHIIEWLKNNFRRNNIKALPNPSRADLLSETSNKLAIIDADPSEDKVSDIKSEEKNEEKIEINNKEINRLCDYIKEKSLLLVPTKSKDIMEELSQLLDTHEREVKDLDSEMYIKYNLTLITYEESRLNLWKELSSLKVEVDSLLKDTNNILNYGEEYVIYLRNCVEKYQSLSYGALPGDGAINNLVNLVKKIDGEYDEIFPYYRDEILKLIFLSIHFLNEINPLAIDNYNYIGFHKKDFDELQILDKLITWFESYFLTNKDKLSSELQAKYYNIKMTMSKDNKFAYIVELAKIIDVTLLLEKDNDKKK